MILGRGAFFNIILATFLCNLSEFSAHSKKTIVAMPSRITFQTANGVIFSSIHFPRTYKVRVQISINTARQMSEGEIPFAALLIGRLLRYGDRISAGDALETKLEEMGGHLEITIGEEIMDVAVDVFAEHSSEAIRLLAELIQHPLLPANGLQAAKEELQRQRASLATQPRMIAQSSLMRALYPQRTELADQQLSNLSRVTIDQLRVYYMERFTPANVRVYVVGSIEQSAIQSNLQESFGNWKPEKNAISPNQKSSSLVRGPNNSRRSILAVPRDGANIATIYIGSVVPGVGDSTDASLDVANALLNSSATERLNAILRRRGDSYSPASQIVRHCHDAEWVETIEIRTEKVAETINLVMSELSKLSRIPPAPRELSAARNTLGGAFMINNSTRIGFLRQLRYGDVCGWPNRYLDNYIASVNAVTPVDVTAVVAKYLRPEFLTIVVVGEKEAVDRQLRLLR